MSSLSEIPEKLSEIEGLIEQKQQAEKQYEKKPTEKNYNKLKVIMKEYLSSLDELLLLEQNVNISEKKKVFDFYESLQIDSKKVDDYLLARAQEIDQDALNKKLEDMQKKALRKNKPIWRSIRWMKNIGKHIKN